MSVESRHKLAFEPFDDTEIIQSIRQDRQKTSDFNRFFIRNLGLFAHRRERTIAKVQRIYMGYALQERDRINRAMQKNGAWDAIVQDVADTFVAAKKGGEPKSATRATIKDALKKGTAGKVVGDAVQEAARELHAYDDLQRLVTTGRVLFYENAGLFWRNQVTDADNAMIKQFLGQPEFLTKAADFPKDDQSLVELAFEQDPELGDALKTQEIVITSVKMEAEELRQMESIIKEQMYPAMGGTAAGAQSTARKLSKQFASKFPDSKSANKWALRIARTEGVKVQNDALMSRATKAGMDGKIWQTVGDINVRDAHVQNKADGIIPINNQFSDGSTNAGSGSRSPWNCFTGDSPVDGEFTEATKAHYTGKMIRLQTQQGRVLTVTPNHPVATTEGFVPAGSIRKGDDLICYSSRIKYESFRWDDVDKQYEEATAQQVFQAFRKVGGLRTVEAFSRDFHGDGRCMDEDVHVVSVDGLLRCGIKTLLLKFLENLTFTPSRLPAHPRVAFPPKGLLDVFRFLGWSGTSCVVGGLGLFTHTCRILLHRLPFNTLLFGCGSEFDVVFPENSVHNQAIMLDQLGKAKDRLPGKVFTDKVTFIDSFDFSGHVFNLSSVSGVVLSNDIVTHNCRCVTGGALLSQNARPRPAKPKGSKESTYTPKPPPAKPKAPPLKLPADKTPVGTGATEATSSEALKTTMKKAKPFTDEVAYIMDAVDKHKWAAQAAITANDPAALAKVFDDFFIESKGGAVSKAGRAKAATDEAAQTFRDSIIEGIGEAKVNAANKILDATGLFKDQFAARRSTSLYMGGDYTTFNTGLRVPERMHFFDERALTDWRAAIQAIDTVMDVGPGMPVPITVFRGMKNHTIQRELPASMRKPGTIIHEKGYNSTTIGPNQTVKNFSGEDGWKWELEVQPGVKFTSGTDWEQEIILERDTRTIITKVNEKNHTIHGKVYPPEERADVTKLNHEIAKDADDIKRDTGRGPVNYFDSGVTKSFMAWVRKMQKKVQAEKFQYEDIEVIYIPPVKVD